MSFWLTQKTFIFQSWPFQHQNSTCRLWVFSLHEDVNLSAICDKRFPSEVFCALKKSCKIFLVRLENVRTKRSWLGLFTDLKFYRSCWFAIYSSGSWESDESNLLFWPVSDHLPGLWHLFWLSNVKYQLVEPSFLRWSAKFRHRLKKRPTTFLNMMRHI